MTQKSGEIPPIEESYDRSVERLSVTERYYTPLYYVSPAADDFCVLLHSNRICVVTLAPSHALLVGRKTVQRVDCQVSSTLNRLDNTVSGKGKRGAQVLNPSSVIFYIHCTDGSKYPVFSSVSGKLVEINERLIENPGLITERPLDQGYLAVVLPPLSLSTSPRLKEALLSADDYQALVRSRNADSSVEVHSKNANSSL